MANSNVEEQQEKEEGPQKDTSSALGFINSLIEDDQNDEGPEDDEADEQEAPAVNGHDVSPEPVESVQVNGKEEEEAEPMHVDEEAATAEGDKAPESSETVGDEDNAACTEQATTSVDNDGTSRQEDSQPISSDTDAKEKEQPTDDATDQDQQQGSSSSRNSKSPPPAADAVDQPATTAERSPSVVSVARSVSQQSCDDDDSNTPRLRRSGRKRVPVLQNVQRTPSPPPVKRKRTSGGSALKSASQDVVDIASPVAGKAPTPPPPPRTPTPPPVITLDQLLNEFVQQLYNQVDVEEQYEIVDDDDDPQTTPSKPDNASDQPTPSPPAVDNETASAAGESSQMQTDKPNDAEQVDKPNDAEQCDAAKSDSPAEDRAETSSPKADSAAQRNGSTTPDEAASKDEQRSESPLPAGPANKDSDGDEQNNTAAEDNDKPDDEPSTEVNSTKLQDVPQAPEIDKSAPQPVKKKYGYRRVKKWVLRHPNRSLVDALRNFIERYPLAESMLNLINEDSFRLPAFLTSPPSQIVPAIVGYADSPAELKQLERRLFDGQADKPPMSESERRDKNIFRLNNDAPAFTYSMFMLGLDLVQERVYTDVVSSRNNIFTYNRSAEDYKKICSQLKPLLEDLTKKNEAFNERELHRQHKCARCPFSSASALVLSEHNRQPHLQNNRFYCTMCPVTYTSYERIARHFSEDHSVSAVKPQLRDTYDCMLCDKTFDTKAAHHNHYKQCRHYNWNSRQAFAPTQADHSTFNRFFWPKTDDVKRTDKLMQENLEKLMAVRQFGMDGGAPPKEVLRKALSVDIDDKGKLSGKIVDGSKMYEAVRQQQLVRLNALRSAASKLVRPGPNNMMLGKGQPPSAARVPQPLGMQPHQPRRGRPPLGHSRVQAPLGLSPGARGQVSHMPNNLPVPAGAVPTSVQMQTMAARLANNPLLLTNLLRAVVNVDALSQLQRGRLTRPVMCELCDVAVQGVVLLLYHFQNTHNLCRQKSAPDVLHSGPPLGCSRCEARFWTYEGLERHLVMRHSLVTNDLLTKAQNRKDSGRCGVCQKQYAFNLLQHLVHEHQMKLCSAEIVYSCDVCSYRCKSYIILEQHLSQQHPTSGSTNNAQTDALAPKPQHVLAFQQQAQIQQAHARMLGPNKAGVPPPLTHSSPGGGLQKNGQAVGGARALPPLQHRPRAPAPSTGSTAKVKYTCTPCSLKFDAYADVIKHWQERHLKQVAIEVCRADKCALHQALWQSEAIQTDLTLPEPVGSAPVPTVTLD